MTKDEALDLALEALEYIENNYMSLPKSGNEAITAIKQARALDKKADNAKELGLDYEPVDGTQVSKVWWDGEKLMAKPIPLVDFYQPAPLQEPFCFYYVENGEEYFAPKGAYVPDNAQPLYTTPPAPAVPDAIHHTDLSENLEYIEGWNDCRAEMLKGMKP